MQDTKNQGEKIFSIKEMDEINNIDLPENESFIKNVHESAICFYQMAAEQLQCSLKISSATLKGKPYTKHPIFSIFFDTVHLSAEVSYSDFKKIFLTKVAKIIGNHHPLKKNKPEKFKPAFIPVEQGSPDSLNQVQISDPVQTKDVLIKSFKKPKEEIKIGQRKVKFK